MKMLVLDPDPNSTVSFYRSTGPMGLLRRQCSDFKYAVSYEVNWKTLKECDILYFQRPHMPTHAEMLDMARKAGVPTVIDYDDLLTDIPEYNPCSKPYNKPEIRTAIADCINLATAITISTPELYKLATPVIKQKFVHIPNAWDDSLFKMEPPKHENKQIRIAWRGSPTHSGDLDLIADACLTISKDRPDIYWFFIGDEPWFARRLPKDRCVTFCTDKPVNILEFPNLLASLKVDIALFPLIDNTFNRSKSNNAWMEWTSAGSILIAPTLPEFIRPGIINYSEGNITNTLHHTIENIEKYRELPNISAQYIRENQFLSYINKRRISLYRTLVGLRQEFEQI